MVSVTVTLTTDGCCACWETETEWRVQAVEMSDCHQWLSRQHWTCVHLRAMCKHLESAHIFLKGKLSISNLGTNDQRACISCQFISVQMQPIRPCKSSLGSR